MDEHIRNYSQIAENLDYMIETHPEIYEAYQNYGRLVHEKGGPLEEKTRWLIKVALSTDCKNEFSLRTHILKALKSGCTTEEIEHAILLGGPTCGFTTMMRGLLVLREALEQ